MDFYGEGAELGTYVEGNQWYFAKINGQWYAVAGEWFRPGQTCKSGQLAQDIGRDATQDEPIHSWVPKPGELVGYAVSGPARNYPQMKGKDERSQVILIPWRCTTAPGRRPPRRAIVWVPSRRPHETRMRRNPMARKVLVATEKPFAKVAVAGILDIFKTAGYEAVLLESYKDKADYLKAVADVGRPDRPQRHASTPRC